MNFTFYALANAIKERDEAKSELVSTKYWLIKERDDAISKSLKLELELDEARGERDYFADQFKEAQNEIFRLHNVISKQHKLLSDKEMEENII